jgi:hypothetical protein
MSLPDSVNAFLAQVREGKAKDTASLREKAQELAADPAIALLHPDIAAPTSTLVREYGDAPLRSTALATIGLWLKFHQDTLLLNATDPTAVAMLSCDAERLTIALQLLSTVSTIRPAEEWQHAMEEAMFSRFVAECEEGDIEPGDFQPEVFQP